MVGLGIVVRVEPLKRQEFLQSFEMLTATEQRDTACIKQNLFEDVDEPNRFLWIESWSSSEALETYLNTDRFLTIKGAIEVLGTMEDMRISDIRSFPGFKSVSEKHATPTGGKVRS
jgi:quinol monooxygenase YgiN